MVQAVSTFLFFAVFILLFIALLLYIGVTLHSFRKQKRPGKKQ
jgi:cbb3-type cytochrome oxidase subunit 3